MINVADYWPFDLKEKPHTQRRFDYDGGPDGMPPVTSRFWWQPEDNALIYADYDEDGTWRDYWYLRDDPARGVAEYRDDYPLTGWLSYIFGRTKKVVLSEPILWGGLIEIGSAIANRPKVDPFKSTPPQFQAGYQSVVFETHLDIFGTRHGDFFNDVLQFVYLQRWPISALDPSQGTKTVGGRYWMAKGVGPVAIQWIGVKPEEEKWLGVDHSKVTLVEVGRIDAKITEGPIVGA